jgi:hypothetical protein
LLHALVDAQRSAAVDWISLAIDRLP